MPNQNRQFNIKNSSRGFTLLELLVAMGIFSLIIGAISWIMIDAFRSNKIIWKQLERQNEGRKVLQQVVDDVRKAEQSSTGAYPIEYVGNNELRFYANIDTDGYREKIRYFLDGTNLKKGVIKPAGNPLTYNPANEQVVILAHNVTNIAKSQPVFFYYGQNFTGSETALVQPVTASDVRVIKTYLELEDDPNSTPVALSVQSMVEVRNLKSN